MMQRRAMIKPVLLAHHAMPEFETLAAAVRRSGPLFRIDFESEQTKHVYYQISDPVVIRQFQTLWQGQLPQVYIADGHHRCSANANLYTSLQQEKKVAETYRYLLCVFFPFDQLIIHEYNRAVEIPREMSPSIFLAALSRLCNIEIMPEAGRPRHPGEMTLYISREWYRLRWKKKVLKTYADDIVTLDAAILNKEIMTNILGIGDIRNDTRLTYIEGISGMEGLVEKTEKSALRAGFCLYPLTYGEIVAMADAGRTLPPKSTWFEPRVKNGMIAMRM
jgi:uncharacterized protein (DUF1015 family)